MIQAISTRGIRKEYSMNINKNIVTYAGIITLSLLLGLAFSRSVHNPSSNAVMGEPRDTSFTIKPSSTDDLITNSKVVFVGFFGEVVNKGEYTHYENGKLILASEKTPPEMRIPFTDYAVNVTEVISGNVTADSQIVVRLPIKVDQETSKKSEKLLFFLNTNNDNATYGPYHYEQSFIDLTTEQAIFADQKSTPVVFLNKNLTSADFLDEVKQKIKK